MPGLVDNVAEVIDTLLAAISSGLKQTVESYCDIQTADSENVLVACDGEGIGGGDCRGRYPASL